MNIEQALKYCEVLEDYYTDETYSLSEFINCQQSRINQLEADKLEAYRAIVELGVYHKENDQFGIWEHCQCGNHNMYDPLESINHREDCIVLKAEKYIREVEG